MPATERSLDSRPLTNPRRIHRRVAASLLVFGIASAAALPQAGAVEEPVSTPVAGTFTTAASTFDLADTIFQGTWDDETGALAGKFLFPAVDVTVTQPIPATISLQVQQPAVGTGTVDLVTNEATFSADLVLALLTLETPDVPGGPGNVAPCNYAMPIDLTGTFDPATGFLHVAQTGFPLSPIADPDRCVWDSIGVSVAAAIDAEIVGTSNAFDATFDLGVKDAEPPPPPPPPPPAPPVTTPTTAPVVAGVSQARLPRTGSSSNLFLAVLAVGLIDLGYLALSASKSTGRRRSSSAG